MNAYELKPISEMNLNELFAYKAFMLDYLRDELKDAEDYLRSAEVDVVMLQKATRRIARLLEEED